LGKIDDANRQYNIAYLHNPLLKSVRFWWLRMKPDISGLLHEKFEDTKGVTRIRKPMKDRQHNGQKK
jgi:hypothetical protein